MEDEDIAPNTYSSAPVHTIPHSVQARLSAHSDWISCTYVFGAISSSTILRPILYTTYYSMMYT